MSLQWYLSREVPADILALGHKLLREDNLYRQLGDRFAELTPQESEFAPMYEESGRGAISPLLLALVTVLQMLEKVPDRVTASWTATRLDWKYALHLPLDYPGFHFTDLYAFRQRLLVHGGERQVFEQMLAKLKGLGLLKRRGKMRTDSTHVLAVVARLGQLELVTESLRVAIAAVVAAEPEWASQALPGSFQELYESRQGEYGLSDSQVQERLVAAGRDGFWFVGQVERSAPASLGQLAEVRVLATVLGQQYPGGGEGGSVGKRPSGAEIIESPHEPQARRASKRGQAWTGYKVQVTESCDEGKPRLIVDLEPTSALANDSPQLAKIQERLGEGDLLPGEQLVDQGYMSGENIATSAAEGIELVGIPLEDTQGPAGFRQSDFQIDEEKRQATCPAGQTSTVWSGRQGSEGEPAAIQIRFEGKTCQACPHFGVCTTSKQGRSLTLHPYRQMLLAQREQAKSESYRKRLHLRAGSESAISELVRAHGLRRARYRGLAKLRLQAYFTAIAVNLKRVIRWWLGLGQTRGAQAAA